MSPLSAYLLSYTHCLLLFPKVITGGIAAAAAADDYDGKTTGWLLAGENRSVAGYR